MPQNELVAVMVPKEHLAKVYGFIASLDAEHPDAAEPAATGTACVGFDDWTSSRLKRMVDESPVAMRDILRAMADHAGEWITTEDLASAISKKADADWNTVAGTMGAFGRRCKNRYGIKQKPFESHYDHTVGSKVFRMPKEIASQIIRIMDNGKE